MSITPKPRIVVLGGGFGGLETVFYLRWRLADKADITLISEHDYFLFKPNMIYVPFGLDPEKLKLSLNRPLQRKNIRFVKARARDLNTSKQIVMTDRGEQYPYDFLVIATGVGAPPEEIINMGGYAHILWTPESMVRFGRVLEAASEYGGKAREMLFMLPHNKSYAAPLYEIVFMVETWLRRKNARNNVNITWVTGEQTYLESFGPRLHEVLLPEFVARDIKHHRSMQLKKVENGLAIFENGAQFRFDVMATFPSYVAAARFPGLPTDERGFISADLGSRRVTGFDNIFVAGDTGDFPLKQGFSAFWQADAVGEHIAARLLNEEPRVVFQPFGLAVLDQLDKATFAQIPLQTVGGVRVVSDSPLYKTGESQLWRLGKLLMNRYLPWRFGEGEPLREGLPWEGLGVGLKVMSDILSS